MTADQGYITCSFSGPSAVMEDFFHIIEETDRRDQFSCGLAWLDKLDRDGEAESDAVSYDTLEATREFLTDLARRLPQLEGEGRLEHGWPVLPNRLTVAEFSLRDGVLTWDEHTEEGMELPEDFFPGTDEDEDYEIEIPLTPY